MNCVLYRPIRFPAKPHHLRYRMTTSLPLTKTGQRREKPKTLCLIVAKMSCGTNELIGKLILL